MALLAAALAGGCGPAAVPPRAVGSSALPATGATLEPQPDPAIGGSCVLYARAASGIDIRGDAYTWWDGAAGRYLRGQVPEVGAVLVLAQSDRLHLGHLAVVRQILDDRDILVDHSNWIPGRIITGMQVRDVSLENDWTALRFFNPDYGVFGSIYAADGFIYQIPPAPVLSQNGDASGQLGREVAAQ